MDFPVDLVVPSEQHEVSVNLAVHSYVSAENDEILVSYLAPSDLDAGAGQDVRVSAAPYDMGGAGNLDGCFSARRGEHEE